MRNSKNDLPSISHEGLISITCLSSGRFSTRYVLEQNIEQTSCTTWTSSRAHNTIPSSREVDVGKDSTMDGYTLSGLF